MQGLRVHSQGFLLPSRGTPPHHTAREDHTRAMGEIHLNPEQPAQREEPLALKQGLSCVRSASLSVRGKSFTEMGLGSDFKGSYSKDLLIV